MTNRKFIFLLIFVTPLIFFRASQTLTTDRRGPGAPLRVASCATKYAGSGNPEKIIYRISFKNIELGRAVFSYLSNAPTRIEGKDACLMTFETTLTRFVDKEKIYSDPATLLPLKIEREVRMWPFKEKITERYDQKNFTLTISKFKGNKKEDTLIRKGSVIHNAILLPFYVRAVDNLEIGWRLSAELPLKKIEIRLISIEKVKVPAGTFNSYRFESDRKDFEIWISADERRIPVKIRGAGILGYTLEMKEYGS